MIKLYWTNKPMGYEGDITGTLIGTYKTREACNRAAITWLETHNIKKDPFSRFCIDARGREWEDFGSWSWFFVREEI